MNKNGKEASTLKAAAASITTATVTIKALRVDGKKFTKSLFDQLPYRPLVDPKTLAMSGEPWGWVKRERNSNSRLRLFVVRFGNGLYQSSLPIDRSDRGGHRGITIPDIRFLHLFENDRIVVSEAAADRWDEIVERLRNVPQLFLGI